jgi:hypothetical protein
MASATRRRGGGSEELKSVKKALMLSSRPVVGSSDAPLALPCALFLLARGRDRLARRHRAPADARPWRCDAPATVVRVSYLRIFRSDLGVRI